MSKLHELEAKRDNIARQMRSLNETVGDATWTDEHRTQFNSMKHELTAVDSDISIQKELRELDHQNHLNEQQEESRRAFERDSNISPEKRHSQAFDLYVRHGIGELNRDQRSLLQQRAQSTTAAEKGGYTVPEDFQTQIIEAMKAYGGVEQHAQVINTGTGRDLVWTTTDGTNDLGAFIAEGAKAGKQDIDFDTTKIGAWKLTSNAILISNELLQDTAVAMDSLIGGRIASRIGRRKADAIVNGTGTNQNTGLDLQVTGTKAIGTAATLSFKDINALIHSLDPAYRNSNFALAFHDTTLQMMEDMVDAQNRPLWLPAVAGMTPATILGRRYFIDQAIAQAGTDGGKFIFAGDWKRFIVRNVAGFQLRRLDELYAESDQTAFLAFHRFDTLLEDTAALKALTWAE